MIRYDQDNVILRCREAWSTIYGRHVYKDRKRTITILAIQSKNAACGRFSKKLLDIGDGKVTTDEMGYIQ
jgi:hypothetical protein